MRNKRVFKFLLGEVAIRRSRRLSRKSEAAEVVGGFRRSPPLVKAFGEVGDRMEEW